MNRASELGILALERVTRIELVLSAWESDRSRPMNLLSSRIRGRQ